MKTINKFGYLIILIHITVIGFVSCSKDRETEVIPKTLEEYKQQMSQFITSEKSITEACKIGYNKGDFKVGSTSNFTPYKTAYLSALTIADTLVNRAGVTIAEIMASNKLLTTPGKNFNGSRFISDRRPLVDPIIAAEALNTATTVGTATGQVPQDAKTAYTTAITTAKATRDATTTIDRQVTDGVKLLDQATTTFKAAIIK
jgi:hypothetical protein